jgi:hypothetical protein
MMKRAAAVVLPSMIGLLISVTSGSARAEGLVVPKKVKASDEAAAAPPPPANWLDYNARPLTLAKGMVGITGALIVDISANKWGKPIWLLPQLYYGVSDQLTVGITGNPRAEFFPTQGGLCLSSSGYCGGKVVIPNNVSFDLLFSFNRTAMMEIAFHGGIDFRAIDPFVASGRGGLLIKVRVNELVAIMADPSVTAGITKRGAPPSGVNNQEFLSVPIRVGFQFHPQINAGLITGVSGWLSGFADSYQVPIGLSALAALNEKIDAAVNLTFPTVVGFVPAANTSHFDYRSVALIVNYRM